MADALGRKKKNALKGREGLVMLGVCAVLGAWIALSKPARDPDAPPPVTDFVRFSSADVTRVEVKRPDGGFTLVKNGGKWNFEKPSPFRANTDSVSAWLKGLLENANVSRTVEGKPQDLASYGLDKPAVELALTGKGGQTRTLQVGKEFPNQSVYYARDAQDGRLFMLGSTQMSDLRSKKVEDLRDKRLLEIEEEKNIQAITLKRPNAVTEVRRQGEDKWQLIQPFAAEAEKFDVDNLLTQVKSAEAEKFVENAATDLAKYGLDQPQLVLQISGKNGDRAVLFGKVEKDGRAYAVRQGEREVMQVAKFAYDGLNKTPADLRSRKLVTLDRDKITSVELTNTHGTVRLQKSTDNQWITAGGTLQKNKVKADMVERILDTITGSAYKHVEEAPKNVAQYGLDKPEITVLANDGRGTNQVFQVGKKSPGGNYYAKGTPNAVFEIQSFAYADLNVKPDAFKEDAKK